MNDLSPPSDEALLAMAKAAGLPVGQAYDDEILRSARAIFQVIDRIDGATPTAPEQANIFDPLKYVWKVNPSVNPSANTNVNSNINPT